MLTIISLKEPKLTIMKSTKFIFIFAFFICETIIGQKAESIRLRHTIQQQFLSNEFPSKNDKLNINDTLQLDSLFSYVNKSWKSFVKDSLINNKSNISVQALNNLDAYSYYLTLRSITGQNELNNDIEYHLFKNYMLPSLINDYQFIKTNPSLSNLKLIWAGSLSNTLGYGVKYYDNTETFRSYYELFKNLKVLLQSLGNSDNETKAYAAKLLNFLQYYDFEIETKKHYFNNQQDISFTYFITGISTNKYPKENVMPFGKTMIKFYLSKGESDKCLAILNNLFFNTTNDELPRDTLLKWYNIVDPVNGSKIYNEALSKFSSNYFKTDKRSPIHLPQKWNLILNSISQDKIKNAKYILIDFWYSNCSPCIAEVPKLNELYSVLKDREDLIFISINADISNTQKDSSYVFEVAKMYSIKFPVVSDNKQTNFTKQFNVSGYPSKFIINNQGQLIVKEDGSSISLSSFYDFIKINK
jgi:thiol-disulfide isomerase/thioredoxin